VSAQDPAKPAEGKPKIPDMVYVKMTTNQGDIYLELNQNKAPITVENFLRYAEDGHYNGTLFHRVIQRFMIQGGGFDKDKKEKKTHPPIKNESNNGLSNKRGTIAMARTNVPDSATCQFFINTVDNPRLDYRGAPGYAVFGRVVGGLDVVDKIAAIPTVKEGGNFDDLPSKPAIIERVAKVSDSEIKGILANEEKRKGDVKVQAMEEGKNLVKSKGADISKGKTSPTGLWYLDTVEGTGDNPQPSSQVKVHYTGWLTNGTKFDSSVDRGQPTSFGLTQVIKGWTEGVGGMKKGGKRFLVIPPELAYGPGGRGSIPPDATLVFEVELIEFD
jgi:FKBP-type peptidyl-prolyl cis-trans isomerase